MPRVPGRIRTSDRLHVEQERYHCATRTYVALRGIEPPTHGFVGHRSIR